MSRRYVIIGNGIAGQTCAEELRKRDADCSIVMLTQEPHPLYNRVALPRFLKGQLRQEKVMLRTVQDYQAQRIDIRFGTTALILDPAAREIVASDGSRFVYDAVLLATGGRPRRLEAPGIDMIKNVHTFYTLDDARSIAEAADRAERVLVLGGSFIAYELADAIAHRYKSSVTWLMRGPHFLRSVLDDASGRLCRELGEAAGVDFVCSDEISHFEASSGQACVTRSGRRIEFDLLVSGLGLHFNTELAVQAGLDMQDGIRTDARLETSAPGVFAAGDVAVFDDVTTGRPNQVGTWDNALAQGRTAAFNMAGEMKDFIDVATYTTTMFGSTLAVMGTTPASDPEIEAAIHLHREQRQYRKLFFRRDSLVGAIMIGSPKGRKRLIDLIRTGEPIIAQRDVLAQDPGLA
jgi:3-phenylpropionate/trans-cinnamate dioxygenase ferredoxin reductase subunit